VLCTLLAITLWRASGRTRALVLKWAGHHAGAALIERGWWSWLLTLYAAGAVAWRVRDAVAAWRLARPTLASWQRQRFQIRRCAHPQRVLLTGATRFIGRIVARD